MSNLLEKVKFGGAVFLYGAKAQMTQEDTLGVATLIGFTQGLKYNGSLSRGIKGGVTTLLVISAINGVKNVIDNYDKIKEF